MERRRGGAHDRNLQRSFVFDSCKALVDRSDTAQLQFAHETALINAFEQSRSLEAVNFKGRTDGHVAQLVSFVIERVHADSPYTKETKETKNFVMRPSLNPDISHAD